MDLIAADGTSVPLGGPKPKTLLLALLQQQGHVVAADRIIDLIWDESPPQSATASVHTYVSTLRRGILAAGGEATALVTRAPGYVLEVRTTATDIGAFTEHLRLARRAEKSRDFRQAVEQYDAALELWRGPALGGVDAGFAREWAGSLLEDRLSAQESRARARLELGQAADVVSELTQLVGTHPLREENRAQLMRALHLSGRQSEALEVYREGREYLLDELGIEPGERLQAMHAEILAGPTRQREPPPARITTSVAASPSRADDYVVPRHLPPDIGDFTGRDEDLAVLLRMGTEPTKRTVVVSGFGGAGKSALAVHAAHLMSARFPDGQLFADLRGAGRDLDAHEVLGRFLQAMGVPAAAVPATTDERVEQYRSKVAGRRLIIVLDNARGEHQVRPLLPGDSGILVVITSRSRLTGLESAEPIELSVLAADAAVAMLGKIIGSDRVATQREAADRIAELCVGVPLAVRAAGAKLLARPHWPLKSLVVRLADERRRLDELTVGDLAIRSSLGMNYAELTGQQRRAFHLLCLLDLPDFGWWLLVPLLDVPPDAAEDIAEHLVDLRLVDVAGVDAVGRVRYRLHDLVQLFGAEQAVAEYDVGISAEVSRAMAVSMALVTATTRRLPHVHPPLRPVQPPAVDIDPVLLEDVGDDPAAWITAEASALVRMVERAHDLGIDHDTIVSLACLLAASFAARGGFDEWQRTFEAALVAARTNVDRGAEAALLAGLGQLHAQKDNFPTALDYFRQASELAENAGTRAVALVGMGNVHRELAEFDAASRDLTASVVVGEQAGNLDVIAAANYGLGAISRERGDMAVAIERFTRSVEVYRAADDHRGVALALRGLSLCHRAIGEHEAAVDLASQAVSILDGIGDDHGVAYARQSWAKASLRMGEHVAAAETVIACLHTCARRHDRFGVALMSRTLGEVHLATGDLAAARESLGEALRLWTELNLPLWEARTLRDLAAARVTDEPDVAAAHWTRAKQLCAAAAATREAAELSARTPAEWLVEVRIQRSVDDL